MPCSVSETNLAAALASRRTGMLRTAAGVDVTAVPDAHHPQLSEAGRSAAPVDPNLVTETMPVQRDLDQAVIASAFAAHASDVIGP